MKREDKMKKGIIKGYIVIIHEKRRAHKEGKPSYGDSLDVEIKRLTDKDHKLVNLDCECVECKKGISLKDVKKAVWRP